VIKIIAINAARRYEGIGKYANDISKIIDVVSVVWDKRKQDLEYIGKRINGIFPPITSGFTINRMYLPILLKMKIKDNVHLLSPMFNYGEKGIITIHDLMFIKNKYYNKLYNQFHKWDIITVSDITKELLIDTYKYDTNQIKTVHLAIDDNVFYDKEFYTKKLVITVGDGGHKHNSDISNLLADKFIHKHIGYETNDAVGFVNDTELNDCYNKSICSIRFSDCEGFGIPAVESLFSGCPIILNRLPIFEELLGYKYPLFVDKLNEIPDMISYASENRAKIINYFNTYKEHYSMPRFVNDMNKIYSKFNDAK
jgi:hypothetical protein